MTAAPGPLGAPAGVATIQPAGVAKYSGRWAEAALLGVALVLGLGGFVLTALNRTGSSPAQTVGVAIAFLVLTVPCTCVCATPPRGPIRSSCRRRWRSTGSVWR